MQATSHFAAFLRFTRSAHFCTDPNVSFAKSSDLFGNSTADVDQFLSNSTKWYHFFPNVGQTEEFFSKMRHILRLRVDLLDCQVY